MQLTRRLCADNVGVWGEGMLTEMTHATRRPLMECLDVLLIIEF